MDIELIFNRPLPDDVNGRLTEAFTASPPILAVVGDLLLTGRYGVSALTVSNERLAVFDPNHNNGLLLVDFADILSAESKRLYGNIIFYVYLKTNDYKEKLIRQG